MEGKDKDKSKDQASTETENTLEVLEKGLDGSLASLRSLLGEGVTELSKAKKGKAAEEEDYDEEEAEADEEGEHEEPDGDENEEGDEPQDKMKKSRDLEDYVAEDDPEAELALDVAPFLKSLTKSMQRYLDDKIQPLVKSMKRMEAMTSAQGAVLLASSELTKALGSNVVKIGQETEKTHSHLRKSGERFEKSTVQELYNKREVLAKSFELLKKGEITPLQATKIEHRVNSGSELPEEVAHLFVKDAK